VQRGRGQDAREKDPMLLGPDDGLRTAAAQV
jgi:hypothetical protein